MIKEANSYPYLRRLCVCVLTRWSLESNYITREEKKLNHWFIRPRIFTHRLILFPASLSLSIPSSPLLTIQRREERSTPIIIYIQSEASKLIDRPLSPNSLASLCGVRSLDLCDIKLMQALNTDMGTTPKSHDAWIFWFNKGLGDANVSLN